MRGLRSTALLFTGVLLSLNGPALAQDKKPVSDKHDGGALVDALGEVINAGADLFNKNADYAGCYRLYQGALMSVRPFLNPVLQKRIELGISRAEGMPRFSDRAFELRSVIDEIRTATRVAVGITTKKEEKTTETKKEATKIDTPKKEEKKAAVVDPNAGQVQGRVTYGGKPAPPGFVTLVSADKRRFSASISADGAFSFKTPIPPGEYRIAIERVPGAQIPKNLDIEERYRSEDRSGLTFEVRKGKNLFDIQLVK